jgi:hypothetical protein
MFNRITGEEWVYIILLATLLLCIGYVLIIFHIRRKKRIVITECDLDYYEIRSGKCKHGSVHQGRIYCEKCDRKW